MKLPGIAFYPASTSNYTQGRNRALRKFTVHHTAALNTTLRYLWANPARNGSSTFFVSDSAIEQYVDTDDTPWTNGNFSSNSESITCETNGDWRFGYLNQGTLNNLTELMYRCLKIWPDLQLEFHKDVSLAVTVCPADLKDLGYAQRSWDIAKNRIKVEQTAANPATPVNLRLDIPDKKVILIRDTNLWDMSFTSFSNARAIKALPKGTVIDVAGVYDHPLSKSDYYLSNWSWDHGQNYGINQADCEDYVAPPTPTTPAPEPTPVPPVIVVPPVVTPPVVLPPTPPSGPGTLPPIPVDPNGEKISEILQIVRWIRNLLAKIFKGE